ncbi:hypothetical protein AB0896_18725 [Streptomyces parvulus]|uniref:hypothetical protein n=1 Tax=Streptomyces parvulus TaxID=146923 RepID=UPI003454AA73
MLDDDQLTAVRYGLDVPQAALLIGVAEVVPLGGGFIECSEVRHGLCFDALQVNHGTIVSASACGGPVLTSMMPDASTPRRSGTVSVARRLRGSATQ